MKSTNQEKKKLVAVLLVIIALVVIITVFTGSPYTDEPLPDGSQREHPSIESDTATIDNAYLTRRGAGEQEVESFRPGNYMEVKGYFNLDRRVEIQFHLLDENEDIIEEKFLPTITDYELDNYYSAGEEISRCCGQAPEVGSYYIGVFAGHPDTEKDLMGVLPFEVN